MSGIPEAALDNTCEAVEYKMTIKERIKNTATMVGWFVQGILVALSLRIIRWAAGDSNMVAHAKREFAILYADLPPEDMEGPNIWIRDNIVDLLAVLATQGHSGGSIGYCVSNFKRLALLNPMSPIEDTPESWGDAYHVDEEGTSHFQCRRLSSLFKEVYADGTITFHDLDAVIYQDEGTDSYYGRGGMNDDSLVTMPYYPPERPKVVIVPKEV